MSHSLNSKRNTWGPEIVVMSRVKCEHIKGTEYIKGTANILADHILRLKSMGLYDSLNPLEHGKEIGHEIFEPLLPNKVNEV